MTEIKYKNKIIVEEYEMLRKSVGWKALCRSQAKTGIKNSLYVIVAVHDGEAVGMTRLLGDGGYVNIIADVIVKPEYQGLGIGKHMVRSVLEHIRTELKAGQSSIVYVMSAKGKEPFYSSLGFVCRPNETLGCGMTQWIDK